MHNYYDLMERKDAKIITAFNEDVKFFTQLIYNDRYSRIDATAVDRKNRKCHLEIKQRTGKYGSFQEFLDKFDTIYLDCGKLDTFSNIIGAELVNTEGHKICKLLVGKIVEFCQQIQHDN